MIPTKEPTQVVAGDTAKWTATYQDYPASGGWALSYSIKNADNAFVFDATASGNDFSVSVDTTKWAPGRYMLFGFVSNGTERHVVMSGALQVLPNLAGTDPYDGRSHNRRVFDNIKAVLEGRASKDVMEYQIGGRALKKTPLADLMKFRDYYASLVMREEGTEPKFSGARFD